MKDQRVQPTQTTRSGILKTSTNSDGKKTISAAENFINSLSPQERQTIEDGPKLEESIVDFDIPEIVEEKPNEVIAKKEEGFNFLSAINQALNKKVNYIEVSPEVFSQYVPDNKSAYFWYQNVRVFKVGTKEEIERLEKRHSMSV